MQQTAVRSSVYVLITLFILYCFSVLLQINYFPDLLSPAILLTASYVVFQACRWHQKQNNGADSWFNKHKATWCLLGASLIWWSVVDILWAGVSIVMKQNPEQLDFFLYVYTVPNLLMATAAILFLLKQRQRWNQLFFALDSVVTSIVVAGFLWIMFFDSLIPNTQIWDPLIFSTFIYIISDAIVLTSIFIWFVSIKLKKMPQAGVIIVAAAVVYNVTDLFYAYLLVEDMYIPNTFVDLIYMLYVLMVAIGIYSASHDLDKQMTENDANVRIQSSRKILFLLFVPVLIALFRGLEIEIMLLLNSMIFIHQFISIFLINRHRLELTQEADKKYTIELEKEIETRTSELIASNLELERMAREDSVTNLDNRRYFINQLDNTISKLKQGLSNGQIVLFYMDIDNFRGINDIYGHEAGDLLLQAVARRLRQKLPTNGHLARLGGDEFVMAFPIVDDYSGLESLAKELSDIFKNPVYHGGYVFNISISTGITIYPQDGTDRAELLKNADLALYHAKDGGHGNWCFFHDIPKSLIQRKNELTLRLREMDYDNELELYYQPQIEIIDGKLAGAEALLRWHQPELGDISPAEFIPIAESTGDIVKIGNWVMKQAMLQCRKWQDNYNIDFRIGINISPIQLDQINFYKKLRQTLQLTGASPQNIDLEITENSAINREIRLVQMFEQIFESGCTISIDDFGTGYSCLSYLKQFKVHRLKIARQLIDGIARNESDLEIVSAITAMAKSLKLKTIAEGVEKTAQLQKLQELGCDEIQGFYYSRPIPATEFEKMYLSKS